MLLWGSVDRPGGMYLLGHLGIALLVFAPIGFLLVRTGRSRPAWFGGAALILLATAPDVDAYVVGIPHRGVTHTVWAALGVGTLLALVCWCRPSWGGARRTSSAGFGFLVGTTSILNHLVGDVLTPMGIRPFHPVSGTEFSLRLFLAGNQEANLGLFVVGAAVFLLSLYLARVDRPARSTPTPAVEQSPDSSR